MTPVPTVDELLRAGVERLRASGSETPRLDAELLLGSAIGADRTAVLAHPEAPVGAEADRTYQAAVDRRRRGEPVAYIRGLKEFYGMAFVVDPRALIPRPETERLVELAAAEVLARLTRAPRLAGAAPVRVVDVGTGSGAIVVALAAILRRRGASTEVEITATDRSAAALDLARENAVAHGVADRVGLVEADLLPPRLPSGESPGEARGVSSEFDLVLANLPYVPSDAVDRLPVAASFEPRAALDGGPDGLQVIRRLLDLLPEALRPDGAALLEIGADQSEAIAAAVEAALPGWTCTVERDLSGLPRVARIARVDASPEAAG